MKNYSRIHKTTTHLEEIFHRQIFIHFSTHYEEAKTRMGHQVVPHALSKPIWNLVQSL